MAGAIMIGSLILSNSCPMNAAQRSATPPNSSNLPPSSQLPSQRRVPHKPKRLPYAGARKAIAFESSVKLTVNLLLATVAATTIAKLIPYHQSQQARLVTLEESVQIAERKNAKLRSQFTRNFDPAQTSRIMQEQSGMGYPDQKKVIWETPLEQP